MTGCGIRRGGKRGRNWGDREVEGRGKESNGDNGRNESRGAMRGG